MLRVRRIGDHVLPSEPPLHRLRDALRPADGGWVRQVLEATRFFSSEEVQIGVDLVDESLARGTASGYRFCFAERADETLGYTCFGPVPLTVSTWDLYWIAVVPHAQGEGIGRTLLAATEERVRQAGGSQLFIDTSGRPRYMPTRAFYRRCGYEVAAELRDFYGPGDSKVILRRRLD